VSGRKPRTSFGWGRTLHELSRAQARLDIELTRTVWARRKKFVVLLLAPIVIGCAVQAAAAADLLPEKIPILGGSKAYMPSLVNMQMFLGSIAVGMVAGLITGVIGAGGGYILTPALMSFGVRGIMAVGTDQFHLFAKAIMGTTIHRKLGNVNVRLAAWFVLGSLTGVTIGGKINRAVFLYSPAMSDALISTMYVVVLGVLGWYAVRDWLRLRRADPATRSEAEATTDFAKRLQALPLRPRIGFDEHVVPGGRKISIYPVIFCGLVVGFVASIMGVGGGFLTFPMFVYGLGVSTFTTVGTDILQIIFTTSYSSITQYAIYGFVFYTVAVGMLLGSLVGVQIGAMVTNMVRGAQIRVFYAWTILAGFSNRACALPRKLADLGYISLPRSTSVCIETIGTVLFFAIISVFSLWILALFARHVGRSRATAAGTAPGERTPLVVNPRRFRIGVVGLVTFAAVLVVCLCPVFGGRTGLEQTDLFFNELAKHSACYIPEARAQVDRFKGQDIDLGVRPREMADPQRLVHVITTNGFAATITQDGRVRVLGDLGLLATVVLDDADLAFRDDVDALRRKYAMTREEVVYCWWTIFNGLTRRYAQQNRSAETNFTQFITTKVLEPAYNFRGIQARDIRHRYLPVAALLGLYVLGTLWYGFAILYLFEGLGITATRSASKAEA